MTHMHNIDDVDFYNSKNSDLFIKEVISKINEDNRIRFFYKYSIVNTKTGMENVLKESSDTIVDALYNWDNKHKRVKDFEVNKRSGLYLEDKEINTNRVEETVCKLLHTKYKEKFIDYQVPLKPDGTDASKGYGKIDLLYKVNDDIYLIELKKYDSTECIARAMLECVTYYKQLNEEKFRKTYKICEKGHIIPAIAVSQVMIDNQLIKNYDGVYMELYKKLHERFGLKIFVYTYNDKLKLQYDGHKIILDKNIPSDVFKPFENI